MPIRCETYKICFECALQLYVRLQDEEFDFSRVIKQGVLPEKSIPVVCKKNVKFIAENRAFINCERNSRIIIINETARRVIELCDDENSISDIKEKLMNEYICNKRKGIVDDCMDKEIIEYAVQLKKVRTIFAKKQIQSSEDIVNIMKHFYDYEDKEKLYVVLLDSRRSVMGINLVSVGTSDSVMIHPGEVFKMAILMGAAAIVMVHNHPSGNVDPSLNDREATDRMIECGKVLDIPLIDHIIFSEAGYYSMYEEME